MKGKICFFGLLLMLLVLFIAAVQGINWGIEDSWTPDNVRNDPLGAFNTNPDRAVSLHPKILDDKRLAERWFNEGDIAKHIQLQPDYAKEHFEGSGLGGVGGEEYIKFVSNGNVKLINGRSDIKIAGQVISNVEGPSLVLEGYPAGTKIEPNGVNGFKVTLLGEGEVVVTGKTSLVNYENGKFSFIKDFPYNRVSIGAESISKINIEGGNNHLITTKEGRVIKIFSEKGFEFEDNVLKAYEGSTVFDTANSAETTIYSAPNKIGDATSIKFFGKEGYNIEGNFLHKFNSEIGEVTVPSPFEGVVRKIAGEKKIKEITDILQGENIRFCYKCGLDVNNIADKTIIFDGKDFYSSGIVSLGIEKGNELYASAGTIKGVVYRTNGKELDILKNPDKETLMLATIESIEKKTREGKVGNLPKKLTEQEIFKLKDEQRYSEFDYVNGYLKDDIRKQAGFETLVASANIKGNSMYASAIGYNLAKSNYDLNINKAGLFSDAITGTKKEPIDYSFKIKGKEEWSIKGGDFHAGNKKIDYYTDTRIDAHSRDGVSSVAWHGEISSLMEDVTKEATAGEFGGGIKASGIKGIVGGVKGALKGKDMPLLTIEANAGKGSLLMESILDEKIVNEGMRLKYAKRFEERIANKLKNVDLTFINGKIGAIADKGLLQKDSAQMLEDYVSNSLVVIQQKIPDRVMGFKLNLDQQNPSQAKISGILIGNEYSVILPEKVVGTYGKNLVAETSSRLEIASQQRTWYDMLSALSPEQLKSLVGR